MAGRPWCTLRPGLHAQEYLLLLEFAGVLGEPRPHGPALLGKLPPRLLGLAEHLREAILRPGAADRPGATPLHALIGNGRVDAETRRETLAGLLDGVSPQELDWLLQTARAIRRRLVSAADRRAAEGLVGESIGLLASASGLDAQARLRDFLRYPEDADPIDAVPYVLSVRCEILCGCALDGLIVLGVHPAASAPQLVGVVIHEAVHIALACRAEPDTTGMMGQPMLDEALATALGSKWMVEQLTGIVPAASWYDDPEIDELAKRVYPVLADSLRLGKRVDMISPLLPTSSQR